MYLGYICINTYYMDYFSYALFMHNDSHISKKQTSGFYTFWHWSRLHKTLLIEELKLTEKFSERT